MGRRGRRPPPRRRSARGLHAAPDGRAGRGSERDDQTGPDLDGGLQHQPRRGAGPLAAAWRDRDARQQRRRLRRSHRPERPRARVRGVSRDGHRPEQLRPDLQHRPGAARQRGAVDGRDHADLLRDQLAARRLVRRRLQRGRRQRPGQQPRARRRRGRHLARRGPGRRADRRTQQRQHVDAAGRRLADDADVPVDRRDPQVRAVGRAAGRHLRRRPGPVRTERLRHHGPAGADPGRRRQEPHRRLPGPDQRPQGQDRVDRPRRLHLRDQGGVRPGRRCGRRRDRRQRRRRQSAEPRQRRHEDRPDDPLAGRHQGDRRAAQGGAAGRPADRTHDR